MKISTLILGAAVVLSSLSVSAINNIPENVEHLYLIGEASPKGWSLGEAPELIKEANGDFTWTGHLGKGQFKFALSRDSWDSLMSAESDNCPVELDTPMPVMFSTSDDWKWYNNEPGDYTLTINLTAATLTVTNSDVIVVSDLFIVGDASPAGWNLGEAPQMRSVEGALVWTGHLGVGQFKLTTSRDSWNAMVSADYDNYGVTLDTPMAMKYNPESGEDDWKWYNNEAGMYTLTANLADNTLTVTAFDASSITALYMVGEAVATGWDRGEAPELTAENGVFTWTGALKAGEVKFLTGRDTWDSVVAGVPSQKVVADETTYIQINPDGGQNDNKWIIEEAGDYTVTVNLAAGTALFTGSAGISAIDADNAAAVYYNLQGIRVDNPVGGLFIMVSGGKTVKVIK